MAVLAWCSRKATTRRADDLAFGAAVTAMLLVSPITWDHALLILLVPLAVVGVGLPASRRATVAYLAVAGALGTSPRAVWSALGLVDRLAGTALNLLVLPYLTYALLGLFGLCLSGLARLPDADDGAAR